MPTRAEICDSLLKLSIPWTKTDAVWTNYGITDLPATTLGYLFTRELFQPTDPYQVSSAILRAEGDKRTARGLGSGWSFSDAVLPQESAVSDLEQRSLQSLADLAEGGDDTQLLDAARVVLLFRAPTVIRASVFAAFRLRY